jgi:hypothetical protein
MEMKAYREFRSEPADASWDSAGTFDAICQSAMAKWAKGARAGLSKHQNSHN